MSIAYLDTHVAVWLHDGLAQKLTQAAKRTIEANELRISPMVFLEMSYLFQRGRCRMDAAEMYANLSGTLGVTLCSFHFPAVALLAATYQWTNDPFDRIIVAQAEANQHSKLITADETIRQHYQQMVW